MQQEESKFILPDDSGDYTPHIALLVAVMKNTRIKTKQLVANLATEMLDYNFDEKSNSIGTILKHIAALEALTQALIFDTRWFTPEEKNFWKGALTGELYLRLIQGNPVEYYFSLMDEVRETTFTELAKRDDEWLFSEMVIPMNAPTNFFYHLYHLVEDEAGHQGQIRIIKRRLPGMA
jgi:Protein of unknown function (DUF664)